MSTTPKTQTATASLVAALAELDNIKANKINPAFKAKYVSLDALLDAIKPVLLDHDGIIVDDLAGKIDRFRPSLMVFNPQHQNPTGSRLPANSLP